MTNLEIAESLSCVFEILNDPRRTTPQTRVYSAKDIDRLFDTLEVAMKELGLDIYGLSE